MAYLIGYSLGASLAIALVPYILLRIARRPTVLPASRMVLVVSAWCVAALFTYFLVSGGGSPGLAPLIVAALLGWLSWRAFRPATQQDAPT